MIFPRTHVESFEFAAQAFDLAERLQTPIFVMMDLDIGMNDWLCQPLAWERQAALMTAAKSITAEGARGRKVLRALSRPSGRRRGSVPHDFPAWHPTKGAYSHAVRATTPHARITARKATTTPA